MKDERKVWLKDKKGNDEKNCERIERWIEGWKGEWIEEWIEEWKERIVKGWKKRTVKGRKERTVIGWKERMNNLNHSFMLRMYKSFSCIQDIQPGLDIISELEYSGYMYNYI